MENLQKSLEQLQNLQKTMEESKAKLDAQVFTGKSAQDLVTVTMTGEHKVTGLTIDPSLVDSEDIDTLQEMILSAISDAEDQFTKAAKDTFNPLSQLGGAN
ncbi:MAG: YbaB/EbfC family nucleoid-associated protein [Streptococcaceae bacterium]|jgi:DNA-binding YbaB/EbfC family protein|nr:YbaB/EbfC family nucleoid-associated protein [Streptococcaceae bacterium]